MIEEVRNGISSFASLASDDEIQKGIKKLEEDIRTGLFLKKSLNYVSELGDYLYVIAKKPESFV